MESMKNRSLFITPIILYGAYIVFISYFAHAWNELNAVDNAEHLSINMNPWWEQINYFKYVAVSLVPTILIYMTIGKSFYDNKVPFKIRLFFTVVSFFAFFVSGVYGTAKGILFLQEGFL